MNKFDKAQIACSILMIDPGRIPVEWSIGRDGYFRYAYLDWDLSDPKHPKFEIDPEIVEFIPWNSLQRVVFKVLSPLVDRSFRFDLH